LVPPAFVVPAGPLGPAVAAMPLVLTGAKAGGLARSPWSTARGVDSWRTPATVPKTPVAECTSQYSVGSVPREKYSV